MVNELWMLAPERAAVLQQRNGQTTRTPAVQRDETVRILPVFGELDEGYYFWLRQRARELQDDPEVASVVMWVNTYGGSGAGVDEAASALFALRRSKRLVAFVDGAALSAGYYLASQSSEIVATRSSFLGSIGTYVVIVDLSSAFQAAGVKVIVIRSGPRKGVGVEGASLSEEDLAELQRRVDSTNALFLDSISRGRNLPMNRVAEIATGSSWIASEAIGLGLADRIGSMESVIDSLRPKGIFAFERARELLQAEKPEHTYKHPDWRKQALRRLRSRCPKLTAEAEQWARMSNRSLMR